MDKTDTYIKMCDCEEIQKGWQPDAGNFYFSQKSGITTRTADFIFPEGKAVTIINIWLPRQDQLQEMVPTKIGSTQPNYKMISELNHFYGYWDTNGIPNILTTWEQLWLAFVMKEKYNKVWDGEKWIIS
ncbi:unnamed protein product [marine sediment metagenome]|uniref:Uncharacterized protein n=1 Tax=marine sediment metagenome TaxID=412755 RepID=X1B5Z7_9ZZZZ